jgi:hypothetical protein
LGLTGLLSLPDPGTERLFLLGVDDRLAIQTVGIVHEPATSKMFGRC